MSEETAVLDAPPQTAAAEPQLADLERELKDRGLIHDIEPPAQKTAVKEPAAVTGDKPKGDQPPKPPEPAQPTTIPPKDDDTPSNKAFANMRTALKDASAKQAAMERTIAELQAKVSPPAPATPPEQAFKQLNDALTGKAENAASATSAAKAAISAMPVEDVRKVIAMAERGELGEDSANILALAREELAPALDRALQAREALEGERQQTEKWRTDNDASLQRITEQHPDLKQTDSALFKFLADFREKYVARLDADGNVTEKLALYPLMSDPSWPEKIIPVAVEMFNAQGLAAKAKEADALKEKLDRQRTPAGGGNHPSPGDKGAASEVEQLEQELRDRGNIPLSGRRG